VICEAERELGRRLPDAFRELLVSDAWPAFLKEFSNCDHPLEPLQFPPNRWPAYNSLEHGLLPFMIENQGVCTWAIRLDDAPDPNVVVEIDSGSTPGWKPCGASFSAWLYCQVLDRKVLDSALFAAQAEPLSAEVLSKLVTVMTERPRTHAWPARDNIRLHCDLGDVLLWSGEDQCDWWIAPRSSSMAFQLLDTLPLATGFDGWLYALNDAARPLLQDWLKARAHGRSPTMS
jgi:hypothetical protein